MGEAVFIVAIVIGLPLCIPVIGMLLKHQEKIVELRARSQSDTNTEQMAVQYQEFVLGVDARMRRMEDRIRSLESRLSQASETDVQHTRQG